MKKLISLAAAVAALFTLTSCEDVLNNLPLNYWYVGSECIIAGDAELEYSSLGDSEFATIELSPKDETLSPTDVRYSIVFVKEDFDKAIQGTAIDVKDVMITSYGANHPDGLGTLGVYLTGFGKYDGYRFENLSGTVEVTLNSANYMTLKVEASSKAYQKKDSEGNYVDLAEADQFEVSISSHFAGTVEVKAQ